MEIKIQLIHNYETYMRMHRVSLEWKCFEIGINLIC